MSIDMRLISVKDGGRFAMSWVAGTNPKALRSNFQRAHVYSVDVPEVCEHMIEVIKSKEKKLSFRILFKLCFGTIHIYAEQVQHLYNVTLNFVCFNTFVMKQYSSKGSRSMVTNNVIKKRRLESSDSLDITSLLLESEIFNDYSEEKFKFPNEIGIATEKKPNTSTSIQIKQITIRQISWDNPQLDEDDAFGEATQDDTMMLLSELSGTVQNVTSLHNSNSRKRKSSFEIPDYSPLKKSNTFSNGSIDAVRCAPAAYNDTLSEFSVDYGNRSIVESNGNYPDFTEIAVTQDELISTQVDLLSEARSIEEQILTSRILVEDLNKNWKSEKVVENLRTDNDKIQTKPQKPQRKRRQSSVIFDRVTKLSKTEIDTCIENIWRNCYNYDKNEHIAPIEENGGQEFFNAKLPSRRHQGTRLLISFKKHLKARLKQDHYINRQLIIEEILGDEYEIYKSTFKLKSKEKLEAMPKETCDDRSMVPFDENNNVFLPDVNNNTSQSNGYYEINEPNVDDLSLKCSVDKIDPNVFSFNFPCEAGKQRSEWGKESILMKLLLAWISKDSNINMSTIIVGANRINAALAFHTLLDLAGQQYIDIVKDKNNSIESIKMGPEMIRKINEKYS